MKALVALGLATLLFACFGNTLSAPSTNQALPSNAVKSYTQTNTGLDLEINEAALGSGIGVRTQGATDNIDALLAKLIVVLPGGVSNQPMQPITVTPLCAGRYALYNPNPDNLVLTWKSSDGAKQGSIVAAASNVTAFDAQGSRIDIYIKNARIASNTSADYACTEALYSVPSAMALEVYKVGTKVRVELPSSLLPGQRFTLFLNVYPPFAVALTRVQTPAEANLQVLLQGAWGLVKDDPRIKYSGLDLTTTALRGMQKAGVTVVMIPENDIAGYIYLATKANTVLLLERWVFFADSEFTMWNLINGQRVDFKGAAAYTGMTTNAVKAKLFQNLYKTAYEQLEGTVMTQTRPASCKKCDQKLKALQDAVKAELWAQAKVTVNVFDRTLSCVASATSTVATENTVAPKFLSSCFNTSSIARTLFSQSYTQAIANWASTSSIVAKLESELVSCVSELIKDNQCR